LDQLTSLTPGTIIRHSPDLVTNTFSISVTAAGLIVLQVGLTSITAASAYALSAGTWTLITASFVTGTYVTASSTLLYLYINNVLANSITNGNPGAITFSLTDYFRVGGPGSFLGTIKQLSIYSPGSLRVNSPASCSLNTLSCSSDLGIATPPSCISCPAGKALLNQKCIVCGAGFYLSDNDCIACPATCATCTSPTSCQSCLSGYNLLNSACVVCPNGYFISQNSCIQCSTSCSKCTSESVCQTCTSGYGLYGTLCLTCPDGMYESNGLCKECPEHCATCTSPQKCQSCINGYYVWDWQCLPEKNTDVNIVVFGSVFIVQSLVVVLLLLAIFKWIKVPKLQVLPVEEDVSRFADDSHVFQPPTPAEDDADVDNTDQTSKKRFRTLELVNRRRNF